MENESPPTTPPPLALYVTPLQSMVFSTASDLSKITLQLKISKKTGEKNLLIRHQQVEPYDQRLQSSTISLLP